MLTSDCPGREVRLPFENDADLLEPPVPHYAGLFALTYSATEFGHANRTSSNRSNLSAAEQRFAHHPGPGVPHDPLALDEAAPLALAEAGFLEDRAASLRRHVMLELDD